MVAKCVRRGPRASAKAVARYPLAGVPFLIKDITNQKGMRVRPVAGCSLISCRTTTELVARYRAAGCCCSVAPARRSSAERHHRVGAARRLPQPVGSARRPPGLERRRRRRGGRRGDPGRPRHRRWRFDPYSGVVLRLVGLKPTRARIRSVRRRRRMGRHVDRPRGVANRSRQRRARRHRGPAAGDPYHAPASRLVPRAMCSRAAAPSHRVRYDAADRRSDSSGLRRSGGRAPRRCANRWGTASKKRRRISTG